MVIREQGRVNANCSALLQKIIEMHRVLYAHLKGKETFSNQYFKEIIF